MVSSKPTHSSPAFAPSNTVERVIVLGATRKPSSVQLRVNGAETGAFLEFEYDAAIGRIVVKKPNVAVAVPWELHFE